MATDINQRATNTMNMDLTNPNQMYMPQILPTMFMPGGEIQGQITSGQQVQAPANTHMHLQVNMAGYTAIRGQS